MTDLLTVVLIPPLLILATLLLARLEQRVTTARPRRARSRSPLSSLTWGWRRTLDP